MSVIPHERRFAVSFTVMKIFWSGRAGAVFVWLIIMGNFLSIKGIYLLTVPVNRYIPLIKWEREAINGLTKEIRA
jgi:hypothetical protein